MFVIFNNFYIVEEGSLYLLTHRHKYWSYKSNKSKSNEWTVGNSIMAAVILPLVCLFSPTRWSWFHTLHVCEDSQSPTFLSTMFCKNIAPWFKSESNINSNKLMTESLHRQEIPSLTKLVQHCTCRDLLLHIKQIYSVSLQVCYDTVITHLILKAQHTTWCCQTLDRELTCFWVMLVTSQSVCWELEVSSLCIKMNGPHQVCLGMMERHKEEENVQCAL